MAAGAAESDPLLSPPRRPARGYAQQHARADEPPDARRRRGRAAAAVAAAAVAGWWAHGGHGSAVR
eukprot:gene1408-63078_t